MKGYWLCINRIDRIVEISFPDAEMFTINSCLATISRKEEEQLLKRLQEVTMDTAPFTLTYEYFSLDIGPVNIVFNFHMFDKPIIGYLYTEVFTAALEEYLDAKDKLFNSSEY